MTIRLCKFLEISTTILNLVLKDERNRYDGIVQVYNKDGNQGYIITARDKELEKEVNISFAKSTICEKISIYKRNMFGDVIERVYFKYDEIKEAVDYIFNVLSELKRGEEEW